MGVVIGAKEGTPGARNTSVSPGHFASPGQTMSFDSRELRRALGAFATGVTVITIGSGDDAYGMTANAFTSVSLDPPLILVCVQRRSAAAYLLQATSTFTINILSAAQEELSNHFARADRPRGADGFASVPHRIGAGGAAILAGAAGHLDCRVHAMHEAG